MSDDKWMNLPTGRRLEQPSYDPNHVGTIGPLRPATEASLRLARRNLREIRAEDVEGEGRFLVDTTTGEEFEVVVALVDLVDPKLTGTTAFTIREGLLVPLRPMGWQQEAEIREAGEIFGREAGPADPLPMQEIY